MKLLSQSTIKQTELELMNRLGEFILQNEVKPKFAGFQPFTEKSQPKQLRKLAVAEAKTLAASARAPYQAFSWMLLTGIFSSSLKQDVLCILKSTIYSQDCDHFQLGPQNPKQISTLRPDLTKKLMLNFFYEMEYSPMENKVEEKLSKNGIIMDVMVSVLRRIAGNINISNETDCETSPSMHQVYDELINYFDLNCKIEGSLFLFYEDDLFILETEERNIVFGEYHKQSNKKHQMKRSKMRSSGGWKKEERDYRSLGIQGISDSVIMEVDADTPSFNFQESQTSFRSSMASEESSMKNSRDSLKQHLASQSLMKANDLKNQMKQSQGLFGSSRVDVRQSLQRKLSKGLEPQGGFFKIMDSPQTASHTPKTIMHGSLCFEAKLEPEMKRSGFCCLKKSQSVKDLAIDCKQTKECQEITQSCSCFEEKIVKNKIFSNLYDISIRIVTEGKERFLSNRDIKAYVMTKGVNMEIFCKSPTGFKRSAKPCNGFPQSKIPSRLFPMKNKLSRSNSHNNLDTFRVPNSAKNDQKHSQLSVNSTPKTNQITRPSHSPVFLKKKQVPTLRLS